MKFLYNVFVELLILGMRIFGLFNSKTKRGVDGRRLSLSVVENAFSKKDKVIWMHAASLGEYEQGLPVLESLKSQFPDYNVLVTFFSPSGFENVTKKKHVADAICYLPFDRSNDVKRFVGCFDVKIFFTVKYDYWYNLLAEIKRKNARVFVISALFYKGQVFFKPYGKWFVNQLKENVDWFFHQTIQSSALAKCIGLMDSSVSGDTRYDRVKQFSERDNHLPFIQEFKANNTLLVIGSSWGAEEDIAKNISGKFKNLVVVIAPHDLKRVSKLQELFPGAVLYSSLVNVKDVENAKILIIDSIGKLSKLYSYADLAIVGGGFHSSGLHNILEAAVYGVPVLFGNHYKKNPEADALLDAGGAKSFNNFMEASVFVKDLLDHKDGLDLLNEMGEKAYEFVNSQPNSTEIIINKVLTYNIN